MHVPDLIILNSSKMIDILFLFIYAVIVWVNFFFTFNCPFPWILSVLQHGCRVPVKAHDYPT